jgi:hypothetical protein
MAATICEGLSHTATKRRRQPVMASDQVVRSESDGVRLAARGARSKAVQQRQPPEDTTRSDLSCGIDGREPAGRAWARMRGERGAGLFVVLAVVVATLVPVTPIGASSPDAKSGWACRSFAGIAGLTPGLPRLGSTKRVTPTISIKNARLNGCRGGVTSGTVSATLKFAKPSNCALLIGQVSSNVAATANGTLTITWNTKTTSTIALSMTFGGVPNEAAVATMTGTVRAGLDRGAKKSWTVLWTIRKADECFAGAPLTSLTFSEFAASSP